MAPSGGPAEREHVLSSRRPGEHCRAAAAHAAPPPTPGAPLFGRQKSHRKVNLSCRCASIILQLVMNRELKSGIDSLLSQKLVVKDLVEIFYENTWINVSICR